MLEFFWIFTKFYCNEITFISIVFLHFVFVKLYLVGIMLIYKIDYAAFGVLDLHAIVFVLVESFWQLEIDDEINLYLFKTCNCPKSSRPFGIARIKDY